MIDKMTDAAFAAMPDGTAEKGFGALETDRGRLPLTAMELDTAIDGLVAHATVSQSFRNVFDEPLEATYIFPLPPRAAVIRFRMIVDGAVIEGRIDERGRARMDYDRAIAEGRSAAIAEEERPDVFTIRVGNIPARSPARVEFTLVAPLAVDGLEATYRFPLVVAERYCPGAPLDGDSVGDGVLADTDLVPDASRISPPVLLPGFPNPVRLGIRVSIGLGTIAADGPHVTTSIPARDEHDGSRLVVIAEPGQRLDRDFILRWPLPAGAIAVGTFTLEPDAYRPVGMGRPDRTAEAPGEGTFSCVILPPAATTRSRQPRDVVFVLDRSGSMGAWQIGAARRALGRMIETLSEDDRLAVIAFDDSVEHFGPTLELAAATDRQRWAIVEWLATIQARGGTEMAAALEAGLKLLAPRGRKPASAPSDRSAMLVLVTDGQIGDEERVLAKLEKRLGKTILQIVGIDTAINEGLLSRLADASGGGVEIVESEARLDVVMDRIQERLVPPLVTNLRIEGHGLEIVAESLVPARMPDLHPGVPLVLRGRYAKGGSGTVTVHGHKRGGAPWRLDLVPTESEAKGLGVLWARGRLRQLEDGLALSYGPATSELEKRIIDLSTAFGVLCRFTAVVVIDDRRPNETRVGALRRIVQPVAQRISAWTARQGIRRSTSTGLSFPLLACDDAPIADAAIASDFEASSPSEISPPEIDPLTKIPTGPLDLASQQAVVCEALALVKPRSGKVADVTAESQAFLFREVRKVIDRLRAGGAPVAVVDSLIDAMRYVLIHPGETAALVNLLDAVASFAGASDRWWLAPPRKQAFWRSALPIALACGLLLPGSAAAAPLTAEQATKFARLALDGIAKEYPHKPADVLNGDADVLPPRQVHPAFHGCYDWHSAVHGHWMLVRILRRFPGLGIEGEIRAALGANLTAENLEAEARFFSRPGAKSFERPYGWAWLLKLAEELHDWDDPDGRAWSSHLRPLVEGIVTSYLDYFPKQTYPNRSGVHSSTAFGLSFALDYARAVKHEKLEALVVERSRSYFGTDERIPAAWEPDGADFFSPSLMEADLMRRVLPAEAFRGWFHRFLPDLAAGVPASILEPATVTDRTDPQLVHLDGLNLSRAWCLQSVATMFPEGDATRQTLLAAAERHAAAGLPHVTSGDYAGEHWLASFATWLLTEGE